jgi:uncharacterized protein (DUF1800 family)
MAKSFTKTGGDLREVMKTMLDSPEFWSEGAWRAKMKSPLEMVASAVRRLDADVDSAFLLGQAIERLGQPLYRKAEPTGYSDLAEEWTTTSGLLQRLNFAEALASNRIRGVRIGKAPGLDADAALLLGSPEFQRR